MLIQLGMAPIAPVDARRRPDPVSYGTPDLSSVAPDGPAAPTADAPSVEVERPLYLRTAAYVEAGTASGQAAPEPGCTRPDPRAAERIGAGLPASSPRPREAIAAPAGEATQGTPIGISGIRRRPGVDALPAPAARGLGDAALNLRLLTQASERYGNGPQGLQVRIGDETLTLGQLRLLADRDPQRFADDLRSQGISVAELNEVLDDALASGVPAGTTLDLRAGGELARAYRLGGADGATVDAHYDRAGAVARAERQGAAESRPSLRDAGVHRPGFFEMIGDAFAELAGLIARAFGSSWNPDTATFDGRVDDAALRARGAQDARGADGLALQALLAQPDGESRLRAALLAEQPATATDRQWRRAVDGYVAGLRQGLEAELGAGRAPRMTLEQSQEAALYLRAQGHTPEARGHVERALAQPQPVRDQALRLLNELPRAERANLISLLTLPGDRPAGAAGPEAYRTWAARSVMANGSAEERTALFETLRRDGFRSGPGTEACDDVVDAVKHAAQVPESLRSRYLALIPQLGVERAHLADDYEVGVARNLGRRSEADGAAFLADVEARVGSTDDLERALASGSFSLQLVRPDAGLLAPGDRAEVLRQLEAHNVSFSLRTADGSAPLRITARGTGDEHTLSLERYFRDDTYRQQALSRTGLDRRAFEGLLANVSGTLASSGSEDALAGSREQVADARRRQAQPGQSAEDLRTAQFDERFGRLQVRQASAPSNLEIDLSAGSRADQLFGLRQGGVSSALEGARALLADVSPGELSLTLRGPATTGGRPGPTHTVDAAEVVSVTRNPPAGQTAAQAFGARWPGLDYRETVLAFATVLQLQRSGTVETDEHGNVAVDLTRRGPNADLNRLGERLSDRTRGNVAPPSGLNVDLVSRTTADRSTGSRLWSSSTVGAAAGNNFYQYGWFTYGGPSASQGYFDTRHAETDAAARFSGAGGRPDPAHVVGALYALDDYTRIDAAERQYGTAAGDPSAFLRDPRSGLPARGQDFTVLSFTGTGSAQQRGAFDRSAQRIGEMFARYGGVPRSQIEAQRNPTPETMYAAIEAELLHDPRAQGDRDRQRSVVVYYAGHTYSDQADGVAGMGFDVNGRTRYFSPEMVSRLNELARARGVNLMFVTDACRAGEYAAQAQTELRQAAAASGTLSPALESLTTLQSGLRAYHQALMGRHSLPQNQVHAPMPSEAELERLGRAALREGSSGSGATTALDALRARRDAVVSAAPTTSDAERRIMTEYVRGVEAMLTARRSLAAQGGMDAIVNDPVLNGVTQWSSNRAFKTQRLGLLEDRLGAAIRAQTPAIQPAEERRATP